MRKRLPLALVLAVLGAVALPSSARALDDGSENGGPPRWQAGRALIKVDMRAIQDRHAGQPQPPRTVRRHAP